MSKTELRNINTKNIDKMTTEEMLSAIQVENQNAVNAVGLAIPAITKTVDGVYEGMKKGGRLFYVGCGTSGRLGVLDASEMPPTYGVPYGLIVGVIAGGDKALKFATEGTEDDAKLGEKDIAEYDLTKDDSVIGISAAGNASYVVGALEYAKSLGCFVGAITSNENTKIGNLAEVTILTDTGAEAITGSTRMKAGSAQKMVLNMISTSVMVKLGYVYENLMINLKPTNIKLKNRMVNIVSEILSVNTSVATDLLEKAEWNIKKALEIAK